MSDRRDDDDELPPSEEELAASKRLRDALEDPSSVEDPDADLARSLRAAHSPDPIDAATHARIVEDVPARDELVLAEALRDNLVEDSHDDPLVTALRAAWNPTPIADRDHRTIIARVIVPVQSAPQRGRVIRVTFGIVTGAIAIAASVFVWVNAPGHKTDTTAAPLAQARSTQPLFPDYDGFKAGSGEASARIDKIALARAGDYRDNRFAKWGVR